LRTASCFLLQNTTGCGKRSTNKVSGFHGFRPEPFIRLFSSMRRLARGKLSDAVSVDRLQGRRYAQEEQQRSGIGLLLFVAGFACFALGERRPKMERHSEWMTQ